jgi:hypothetical protein
MRNGTKVMIAVLVVLGLAAIATGVSVAGGSDDVPLVGEDLDRASQAAIDHVGGGTVVESEAGEGSDAFEVVVRLDDGTEVEVHLDEGFTVTDAGPDDESGEAQNDEDAA